MNEAITKLVECIKEDYKGFGEMSSVNQEMYNTFCENISVQEGRKYIKIVTNSSVWGFIVKSDDDKFKAGDILKAASWATPARNKARGNILQDDYTWVRWTGPAYL